MRRVGFDWHFPARRPASADGFEVLGVGATRVALLGPDGVVYKASWDTDGTAHASEREVFDILDRYDVPCCPDFWPYDELRVMAMRRYRPFDGDPTRSHVGQVLHGDVSAPNCGVDEDGRVVLLDGGAAMFIPGALDYLARVAASA